MSPGCREQHMQVHQRPSGYPIICMDQEGVHEAIEEDDASCIDGLIASACSPHFSQSFMWRAQSKCLVHKSRFQACIASHKCNNAHALLDVGVT